jgi:hypothetical protein
MDKERTARQQEGGARQQECQDTANKSEAKEEKEIA